MLQLLQGKVTVFLVTSRQVCIRLGFKRRTELKDAPDSDIPREQGAGSRNKSVYVNASHWNCTCMPESLEEM